MIQYKNYEELRKIDSFDERLQYLKLKGNVGVDTFGFDRFMNQQFYKSREWKKVRDYVIVRDNGCDMGLEDYPILGRPIIHHMNPISPDDIKNSTDLLLNPNYLISVSHGTHNYIHYGTDKGGSLNIFTERKPNDTCPWK